MSIFSSTIFGKLTKKVGNVVTYTSRGVNIVKGAPLTVNNPRTKAQRGHRLCFGKTTHLSGVFYDTLLTGFPKGYITFAMNTFVKVNMPAVTVDDNLEVSVDYRRLLFAVGTLTPPMVQVTVDTVQRTLTFTSTNQPVTAKAFRDDRIYLMLFEEGREAVMCKLWKTRRDSMSLEITIPEKWNIKQLFIYTYAVAASRRRTSNSVLVYDGSVD